MNHFDCDWAAIAAAAPKWDALPLPCKRLFLQHVEFNQPLAIGRIKTDFQPLLEAGFLELAPDAARVKLPAAHHEFWRIARAMARHAVFHADPGKEEGLPAYLQEHFSHEEHCALSGNEAIWGDVTAALADEIGRLGWLERFLAETDYRRWDHKSHSGRREQFLISPISFDRAKAILRILMKEKAVLTFPELCRELAAPDLNAYGPALRALIGHLLAFPALSGPNLQLAIGLWPALHRRLHRQKLTPPADVIPARTFSAAFLMDDMTLLLVACSAEPLRVRRNDGWLFSKVNEELGGRLASLPEWFIPIMGFTAADRLRVAQDALMRLRLSRIERSAGKKPGLGPADPGAKWLQGSDGERLKHILAALRDDLNKKLEAYGGDEWETKPRLRFANLAPGIRCDLAAVDCRPALTKAFASLPGDGHVRLGDFLDYHANERNPFIELQRAGRKVSHPGDWQGSRALGEEELEKIWRALLERFLVERLVPLGCAAVGVAPDNKTTLGLTGAGRYLLGQALSFEVGGAGPRDIIVQPNLEIVFLAPSPAAEAAASRLAERVGHRIGVLFRVTRRSIHEAFATGLDAAAVLARLGELSRKPIPDNVARQIRDWAAQCRKVEVSTAVLFHCADRETALRVLAAGGKQLALISDTVVALSEPKALKDIQKKLRQNGITRA